MALHHTLAPRAGQLAPRPQLLQREHLAPGGGRSCGPGLSYRSCMSCHVRHSTA
jgi:hypothetical protein